MISIRFELHYLRLLQIEQSKVRLHLFIVTVVQYIYIFYAFRQFLIPIGVFGRKSYTSTLSQKKPFEVVDIHFPVDCFVFIKKKIDETLHGKTEPSYYKVNLSLYLALKSPQLFCVYIVSNKRITNSSFFEYKKGKLWEKADFTFRFYTAVPYMRIIRTDRELKQKFTTVEIVIDKSPSRRRRCGSTVRIRMGLFYMAKDSSKDTALHLKLLEQKPYNKYCHF